ncbi:MAG TPA: EscU/YscU/HrcU family type III secretion system export apparatus switch protein [Marmoricola sp.]|nr:EscU/YscU/HrcU family type III secretion system export apparatus switch protein [Marmoricola sp.]
MSEEKTEAPTAKKRKESRKEGQVPRTQELGSWSTLLAFGMLLDVAAGRELTSMKELMVRSFRLVEEPDPDKALALLGDGLMHVLVVLVTLGGVIMVIGVAAALAQGGFYLATKSVKPKLSKLNPMPGAKRMFGPQALWEGTKILLKSLVVALICYSAIRAVMPLIGGFVPSSTVLEVGHDRIRTLLRTVAVAGLVMAVADYAFQRRRVGKQTRMTKHEVKQENKQTEGDPLVKSAIRSRQLAAARNRMMADIPQADVVLVNPTHVAVALRYDPAAGAPKVVARGAGAVASRIREKAEEAKVPLVRDVPLARALYGSCQVGQEIPAELFAAVAQVLAFVIGRRTQGQRGGTHNSPRLDAGVPVVPKGRRRPR